ncbi:MAG: 30S ribosome-binding factor RbfA [Acidobacteriia bacterium]|nr:30S ribosome-binding factor RbfA [Terriglobia bacterium]
MERRNVQHHYQRLGEVLREEIAALIEGELTDPRIGLATVTEVKMSPDGKSAHISIHVSGNEQDAENTLAGLDAARSYIRHELLDRLRIRHVPDLFFHLDRSQQYETRIDQLLRRVKKRSK